MYEFLLYFFVVVIVVFGFGVAYFWKKLVRIAREFKPFGPFQNPKEKEMTLEAALEISTSSCLKGRDCFLNGLDEEIRLQVETLISNHSGAVRKKLSKTVDFIIIGKMASPKNLDKCHQWQATRVSEIRIFEPKEFAILVTDLAGQEIT